MKKSISWRTIKPSLTRYEREKVEMEIREILEAYFKPHGLRINRKIRQEISQRYLAVLDKHTGVWSRYDSLNAYVWNSIGLVKNVKHGEVYLFIDKGLIEPKYIPDNVQAFMDRLDSIHRYLNRLKALFESITMPKEANRLTETFKTVMPKIVSAVEVYTNCDDAWYVEAEEALRWFLEDKWLDKEIGGLDHFINQAIQPFRSWICPEDDEVQTAAERLAVDIVRELFIRNYFSEGR
jgi:hypothetical protein